MDDVLPFLERQRGDPRPPTLTLVEKQNAVKLSLEHADTVIRDGGYSYCGKRILGLGRPQFDRAKKIDTRNV